jgi:hypothetical protein
MTRVGEHEDADLLLFEAGACTFSANAPRYGLSFSRQFSLESDSDDVGLASISLAVDFGGDDVEAWPVDQLWGYAGRRRDVSNTHHPEIANWAGHVPAWALQLRTRPAFRAFTELRPVRISVDQSDI